MTSMGKAHNPRVSLMKYLANKNLLPGATLIKSYARYNLDVTLSIHLTLCTVLLYSQIFFISTHIYLTFSTQGRKDIVQPLCPSLPHTRINHKK